MAVAGVLVLGLYYARVFGVQVGMLVLLIVTSVEDHYTFRVGPVAVRAEQVAMVMALVVFGAVLLRGAKKDWLRPSLAEGFLLAWFAIELISSLLGSPDRRLSAKNLALLAVTFVVVFLPRRLLAGSRAGEQMETVLRWLLIAFATEAAYGTIVYLVHVVGPTISIGPNPASGYLGAYGSLWEQNVFGAYSAAGVVAWAYLGPARFRSAWVGLALCIGGLGVSLTRAAWLAAAAVGGLGVVLPRLRQRLDLATVIRGAAAGLVLIGTMLLVDRSGSYSVPLPHAVGVPGPPASPGFLSAALNRVDVLGRINQIGPVLGDLRGHLLLGRGTASYESLHTVAGSPEHIASLPLLILEDGGIVGLALFGAFILALAFKAWSRRQSEIVVALGQVALVLAITNLATQTTELMVDWLLIGLLLAAVELLPVGNPERGAPASAPAGTL